MITFLILIIPVILWISSIYLLLSWNKFVIFFVLNGLILVAYVWILNFGKSIFGHDEYGLGFLLRLIFCLLLHVLIVFVFAIIKHRRLKIDGKKTSLNL